MDICDRAQIEIERAEAAMLARRLADANPAPSRSNCMDCGQAIPEPRRRAIAGVLRCIDCEQLHEQRLRGATHW